MQKEIVLDDWEKEALEHRGDLLLCTGRQIGKTYILSRKCAIRMLEKPNTKIIIASLTEDQAKLIIIMIVDYLEKYHKKEIALGKQKPTQNKVHLKNGSEALARPVGQTGDALRGFTGDILILDEVARFSELIMTSAKPTLLSTGGEIWAASTPKGKKGYFWDCFQNKDGRFKVIHASSEDIIRNRELSEGWTQEQRDKAIKFLEAEKKEMSSVQYGQEYLGLFLEEIRQYFPDELIARCCILKRPQPPIPRTQNYLGVDIARMGGDECAYVVLHKSSETATRQIESITKTKQLTTQTEQDILNLNEIWNTEKIGIDMGAGSLGVGIGDRLMQNPITKRKIVPMNNRKISLDKDGKQKQSIFKEDMYDLLYSLMERGEIYFLDDENIKTSLQSIQWEIVEKSNISKFRIFSTYGHLVEALVRAAWLSNKNKVNKLRISYI